METSTGDIINTDGLLNKQITITVSVKKIVVVATATLTFISGTAGPFLYTQYNKKIEQVKESITNKYEFKLAEAKYKEEEATRIKTQFTGILNTVDFLKVHSYYNTCYILYSEKPNKINKQRYDAIVIKYAEFIKHKNSFNAGDNSASFYLSDEAVYVDGVTYTIPYDVAQAIKDIKTK